MRDVVHESRRSIPAALALVAVALALPVATGCDKCGPKPPPAELTHTPAPAGAVSPTVTPAPALHAWANPITIAGVQFADHTWVTTYDAPGQCPPPVNYWFSWGSCHGTGPQTPAKALGTQGADLDVARCLCTPDLEDYAPTPGNPAHGGIDFYGITGVCHQLSNRILWASRSGGAAPLTVSGAMGYGVSRFLYGAYGTNAADWGARVLRCAAPAQPTPAPGTPVAMAMRAAPALGPEADFSAMLTERLGPELPRGKRAQLQQIHARLLQKKALLDRAVRSGRLPPARFANGVNELVNQSLREAAEVLTPEEYERLFGIPKGMTIGIVDPTIAERSNYRPG